MEIEQAIGVTLFESDDFGGWKIPQGGVCPTQRANKTNCGIIEIRKVDMVNARNTILEQSRAEQSRAA